MKRVLFLFASIITIIGVTSCKKVDEPSAPAEGKKVPVVFSATSSDSGAKTSLSGFQVVWSADDQIKVFTDNSTSGDVLTIKAGGAGKSSADFEGEMSEKAEAPYYASYPATVTMAGDKMQYTIPESQRYVAGGFDTNTVPALAYSAQEKKLAFQTMCGLLKFHLTCFEETAITTMELKATNIAGVYQVNRSNPAGGSVTTVSSSNSIKISNADGMTITPQGVDVYFAVAPGTYSDLSLHITIAGKTKQDPGKQFTLQKYSTPVTIERNQMKSTSVTVVFDENYGKCDMREYTAPVTINGVTWMSENWACRKYDSDAVLNELSADMKKPIAEGGCMNASGQIVIPWFPETLTDDIYCLSSSDTKYWDATSKENGKLLSSTQMAMLGYAYNWAAVVGVMKGKGTTGSTTEHRQGICPNGWRLPLQSDFESLVTYAGGKSSKKLRSKTGWASNKNGTDDYNFNGLPAGAIQHETGVYENIGAKSFYASSTASSDKICFLKVYNSDLSVSTGGAKTGTVSVRCIKK